MPGHCSDGMHVISQSLHSERLSRFAAESMKYEAKLGKIILMHVESEDLK